jgi:hypothetical protein
MNHDGKVSKADNIDQTMTTFRAALARMDANPGEAARIRNLANATDAQVAAEAASETLRRPRAHAARTYGELIALTADVQAKVARVEETSGRARPWWLQGFGLALGGILVLALAGTALSAALISSAIGFFLVGVFLGLLTGGLLCARYLREEIAANISPRLEHMQRQLDIIETEGWPRRYAETSVGHPGGPPFRRGAC